jgi:hypothetical protein
MKRTLRSRLALYLGLLAAAGLVAGLQADDKPAPPTEKPVAKEATATPVKPKPLSDNVKKGLAYLVNQQHEDGGWGQGGGWRTVDQGGRVEGANVQDPSDVGNTCLATLALLRAGNTPKEGKYAKNVAKAIEFVCTHVEKADADSLYVTSVRGTQLQTKIGQYVDTFLAALVLAEVKNRMPDENGEKRLVASLGKAIGKIEKHQKDDGTFAGNTGWASIFSQGLASKGLNRARQNGLTVKDEALVKAEKNALAALDPKTGTFRMAGGDGGGAGFADGTAGGLARSSGIAGRPALSGPARAGTSTTAPSDAGVPLYNASNQVAALQEAATTNKETEKRARETIASKSATRADKQKAQSELKRVAQVEEARKVAVDGVVKQLGDQQFLQGFGSNGGEEFLSFLNIGEVMVAKGGDEWTKWDKAVTDSLNRVQDKDGGWSGSHCITGRVSCTAAALLVLMVDRTPAPAKAKEKGEVKGPPNEKK